MRVICCPTNLHPVTELCIKHFAPQTEMIDITGREMFGYWEEITRNWGLDDLITIEQDMAFGPGMVKSLAECDQEWCSFAYRVWKRQARVTWGTGFMKLSARLQQRMPLDGFRKLWGNCFRCHGRGCWDHIDVGIRQMLDPERPHVHGDVVHLHDYTQDEDVWRPV